MNPYVNRSMIVDAGAFFGREDELRRIYDLLARPSSINIVGNRRIGKSSLLAHIMRSSSYQSELQAPDDYLFLLLDLQELAGLTQPRFFATIMARAAENSQGALTAPQTEEVDARTFRRFIRQHFSPGGRKLVCCFDEFEKMSGNPDFDIDFFHNLRAFAQQYQVGYVISSRVGIEELCHRGDIEGSQFWNIFTPEPLRLLRPDEAHELTTRPFSEAGMPLEESHEAFVRSLAGSYPFFIQIACFHLFSMKRSRTTLTSVDLEDLRSTFLNEVRFHFDAMIEHLDEDARSGLVDLASDKQKSPEAGLARDLLNQGLISMQNGTSAPFSDAFATFLTTMRRVPDDAAHADEEKGTRTRPVSSHSQSGDPNARKRPSAKLSVCLWGDRSAVVELQAARRLYTVTDTEKAFDATTVEKWRRRAFQIFESGDRWRENLRREGSQLFKEIFVDNARINGAFSAGLSQAPHEPMEILFRTPRELLSLPLELLFEEEFASGEEGPLALLHPITRYVTDVYFDRPTLRLPLEGQDRLRILLLAGADSYPVRSLQLDSELMPLVELWNKHPDVVERVDVVRSSEHAFTEIQEILAGGGYDLVHYAGHGKFDHDNPEDSGLLFFERGQGKPLATLTTSALQDILFQSDVRLFFLNACSTAASGDVFQALSMEFIGLLDALIVAKIPTIVGLRWPIMDASAIELSHTFYKSFLATGSPAVALWHARRALARRDRNDPGWASPILIAQEG